MKKYTVKKWRNSFYVDYNKIWLDLRLERVLNYCKQYEYRLTL